MGNKTVCRSVLGVGNLINKFRDGKTGNTRGAAENIVLTRAEGGRAGKKELKGQRDRKQPAEIVRDRAV